MVEVCVPHDLWDDDREAVIVSWLYNEGAAVNAGQLLAEIQVEKAQMEINAPASGTLVKIVAQPESVVRKGDVIAVIEG